MSNQWKLFAFNAISLNKETRKCTSITNYYENSDLNKYFLDLQISNAVLKEHMKKGCTCSNIYIINSILLKQRKTFEGALYQIE